MSHKSKKIRSVSDSRFYQTFGIRSVFDIVIRSVRFQPTFAIRSVSDIRFQLKAAIR